MFNINLIMDSVEITIFNSSHISLCIWLPNSGVIVVPHTNFNMKLLRT